MNKQSWQLTQREKNDILSHPCEGAKFVEEIPALRKYRDAVLGHHKSWDGKIGYPADFDNTRSNVRFLIEILHISDCLDAATDFVGRSYKNAKKLEQVAEEFSWGKWVLFIVRSWWSFWKRTKNCRQISDICWERDASVPVIRYMARQ
ncbi:MAG: HD domain-containing phosphohydrolase [Ruminococcus sp.]